MYDIVIIGAGPAGLTAGIYGARAAKKVLILEKSAYGGQIINAQIIENFPTAAHISGVDFANKLYNQVKELGVEIRFEKAQAIKNFDDYKEITTDKGVIQTKSIIIATGCKNRTLDIDNEKKFGGRGISYCATCDGNFFRNKKVAVVGGGNTAIDDALFLSGICEKVYLIHRRDEFRANQKSVEVLEEKENVYFILNSVITRIIGEERLEAIEVNNKDVISIDGLFVAVGMIPENEIFTNLIKTNETGYIIAGEDCHTNIPGIFASGDARTKALRQLVTAVSDGAVAAEEAVKYLNKKNSL